MPRKEKSNKFLLKTAIHGSSSVLTGLLLNGNNLQTKFNSQFPIIQGVPLWIILAGAGITNSLLTDFIHMYIKPEINTDNKFMDVESMALSLGISVTTMNLILYLLSPAYHRKLGIIKSSLLAIGSEVVAEGISANMAGKM